MIVIVINDCLLHMVSILESLLTFFIISLERRLSIFSYFVKVYSPLRKTASGRHKNKFLYSNLREELDWISVFSKRLALMQISNYWHSLTLQKGFKNTYNSTLFIHEYFNVQRITFTISKAFKILSFALHKS